ncbi:MAG: acyl-CoA dehydrogenase [Steroidobacteraceae bacterium]|jgi:alkylation response protein AidB-like acyl-CoA dehydrogenase
MTVPLKELEFTLLDVLGFADSEHDQHIAADLSLRETALDVLINAEKIAVNTLAPSAQKLDIEEPYVKDGRVVLPIETQQALKQLAAGGFIAMSFDEKDDGLDLPFSLSQACAALFASANVSIYSYALLTQGAANLIAHFGSPHQRARWVPEMLRGQVFGTMCLSEPHAGSSLADILTVAVPRDDGRFSVRGRKMWISGGEHELGENIAHLVLARTPDAPAGVKGISLFLVPRFRNATTRESNGVTLIGLNHKMGWRGHVNTALAFGDEEECIGELIGSLHQGLTYMFLMMNEARVTVGLCAAAIGFAGYQYSLAYAHERRQGRKLGERNPDSKQVPIIEHADIKRMLLAQKVYVEGGLDLVIYCAKLVDILRSSADALQKQRAALLLDLLTPIAKSWPAEYGLEANKLAIQIAGGAGYTRDLPLERLYRDNRLNPIHEGALGIHGLDLLGRKVSMHDGEAIKTWQQEIEKTLAASEAYPSLLPMCQDLRSALDKLLKVTETLVLTQKNGNVEQSLANATLYLDAFGGVTVGWRWLVRSLVATQRLTTREQESDINGFLRGKIKACEYFRLYELPRYCAELDTVGLMETTPLTMQGDEF